MAESNSQRRFFCHCCERELDGHLRSPRELVSPKGLHTSLCKQCDGFLTIGLPHVMARIQNKNLQIATARAKKNETSSISRTDQFQPAATHPSQASSHPSDDSPALPAPNRSKVRAASATECDAFSHRSLAVTRYIEGFIQGLEVAGVDRSGLHPEATNAINILLGISQKLASERLNVMSGRVSRSEVRRLTRHIKETSLMVDEYVSAVGDAYKKGNARRQNL